MEIQTIQICHLIKSEDLNHHGTLYAGRTAEWFVETGFVAAARLLPPEELVCLKIHGMEFLHPVHLGDITFFEGKVVYTGRTSLIAYIHMSVKDREIVSGFITFIHVDQNGVPMPHGITVEPVSVEEQALNEKARSLVQQNRT
jgi:acyl-CoA hydrolase